jgi:hypothetical protein
MMLMPGGGASVLLAVAVFMGGVALAATFFCYFSALNDITPLLPPSLRDPLAAKFAIEEFVWDSYIPKYIRRRYFFSHVFVSVFFGFTSLSFFLVRSLGGSAAGFLFFIFFSIFTTIQWIRHRDKL